MGYIITIAVLAALIATLMILVAARPMMAAEVILRSFLPGHKIIKTRKRTKKPRVKKVEKSKEVTG